MYKSTKSFIEFKSDKTDLSFFFFAFIHQLIEDRKDDLKPFIRLAAQFGKLLFQFRMHLQHLSDLDKSPHDLDVNLDSSLASQNTGKH